MGRKIPARKHFGVRDPIKQKQEREALVKDKINNPPERCDYQKVSHSLARFIKLKEAAKTQQPQQKKNSKRSAAGNEDKPENYTKKSKKNCPDARTNKVFDNIHQKPNESDSSYMRRVNRITQESVEEAKFEAKYGVEVIRDKKTGEIKLKKRPANEIDERLKQNAANAKKGGRKTKATIVIAPEERKKLIKAMIQEKKQKESQTKTTEIKEFKQDEFKFGEVVNEPPQLTVPRLAKKAETVPRPGRKSLLLHSVIDQYSKPEEETPTEKNVPQKTSIAKAKKVSLKGKRKDLSMAMRKMIESEQDTVVKLYKELKKNNRAQNKT
ncbi:coiled-coil domain-containing protein 137 [Sitodiplosis mosellana]|uniref:coiled-coil domain-containing protein 137 n=1 Tax=Sitodiplosis mosellana TaxID=263140 RepID=UPI002444AC38|nr:coiled-coil domain-containing protein 137 [Sitodiplosis mosellana]